MPRQDVPYPTGTICRLRERIGELFDLLGQKLHSINGVEGDGQGNVTIKSGDAAVVINNDQAQHEIEIALDSSQLPAAAVSSVNGQTGAVALTADDIPSDNGDVQTDIDNLEAADTTLQGNINAEALARQNADSTLQTNINAVTAGIPTEVSNQIAADNTIVRTSGNQNIADVKTVATQATGSYSQQIANSQKVKNELDNYAPMARLANAQTFLASNTFSVGGTFARPQTIKNPGMDVSSTTATGRSWIWVVDANNNPVFILQFNQEGTTREVRIRTYRADGTYNQQTIASA